MLWQDPRNKDLNAFVPQNAALEWQAESMRWHSKELVVACPLEGLVRRSFL